MKDTDVKEKIVQMINISTSSTARIAVLTNKNRLLAKSGGGSWCNYTPNFDEVE